MDFPFSMRVNQGVLQNSGQEKVTTRCLAKRQQTQFSEVKSKVHESFLQSKMNHGVAILLDIFHTFVFLLEGAVKAVSLHRFNFHMVNN